jgi:hypothetical protein
VAERLEIPDWLFVDETAGYAQTITINLDALEP